MTIKLAFLSNDRAKFKEIFECNLVGTMKIHQHNAGHMSKKSVMLIYGKPFKNLLSRNNLADFDEILYDPL